MAQSDRNSPAGQLELEARRAEEFRRYAAQATSEAYRRLWTDRAEEIERTVIRMRQARGQEVS